MRAIPITALALSLCLLAGCDDFPRDPKGTLERVQDGVLRLAMVEQAPWATQIGERQEGLEVELARRLAGELGAELEWSTTSGEAAFRALRAGDIDLLIGGLTEANPWTEEAGATRRYLGEGQDNDEQHVWLVPRGENAWLIAVDSFLQRESALARIADRRSRDESVQQ